MKKSSPSMWQYVVTVKSTVKISLIYVAFLENIHFNLKPMSIEKKNLVKFINIFLRLPCFGKKEKKLLFIQDMRSQTPNDIWLTFWSFSYFMSSKIQIVQFCMQIMTSKSYAFQHPILTKIEEQHRTFCASSHTLLRQK